MRRTAALVLASTLACTTASSGAPTSTTDEDVPSVELLEYLADFEEDEQGRLLDPLGQTDRETREWRDDDSDRDYWQRQNDR